MTSGRVGDFKVCAVCGRRMEYRARWADVWSHVRHCSQRCRRRRLTALDHGLETAIRHLLAERAGTSTVCPSEAAKVVRPDAWRPLMGRARAAGRRLAARDLVEFRQDGKRVDPSRARGPVRIGRGQGWHVGHLR